jgi:hypothetical protein
MKPFDVHQAFDEPAWFGDSVKPVEPTARAASSNALPSWLEKLHELLAPKTGPVCQRS